MKPFAFLLLVFSLCWLQQAAAIVKPVEVNSQVPGWLARIYVSRGGDEDASMFCYGALIDKRWVLSSAGCFTDPYRLLRASGNSSGRQYSVRLGEENDRVRVVRRYQSPDAGMILYELASDADNSPVVVSKKKADELEGEPVVIIGMDSSEPLGHSFYNPAGERSGSCEVNNERFYGAGVLCYIFTYPVRHNRLVKTEARIIDPSGPQRPDSALDDAVNIRTDGSRIYLRYANPDSYACIEDMGMPIVSVQQDGSVALVGMVNATGMAVGLPLCSASMAHWYTAVSHYRDFFVRAKAESRLRAVCPAQPRLLVGHVANGNKQLYWEQDEAAESYRLYFAPVNGRKDIRQYEAGNVTLLSVELQADESYEVALQGYNSNCTSPLSFPVFLGGADQ